MKLKYDFDEVEMGDEIISVPVGDGADEMHGVIKLNKSGKEILELLKNHSTVDEIVNFLASKYDNDKQELCNYVTGVINILKNAGIIEE